MSLLDLAGSLLGGNQGGGNILGTLLQAVNGQAGGLGNIVAALQQGGLGSAVSSWISTGANHSVTPGQIQGALSGGILQDIAAKLGVTPEVAAGHLAEHLPNVVDKLTPSGVIPEGGLTGAAGGFLQGILSKLGA